MASPAGMDVMPLNSAISQERVADPRKRAATLSSVSSGRVA